MFFFSNDLIAIICVSAFLVQAPGSQSLRSHVGSVCLMIPGLPVLGGRDAAISGINNKKDKQTSRGSHVVAEPEEAAGSSS